MSDGVVNEHPWLPSVVTTGPHRACSHRARLEDVTHGSDPRGAPPWNGLACVPRVTGPLIQTDLALRCRTAVRRLCCCSTGSQKEQSGLDLGNGRRGRPEGAGPPLHGWPGPPPGPPSSGPRRSPLYEEATTLPVSWSFHAATYRSPTSTVSSTASVFSPAQGRRVPIVPFRCLVSASSPNERDCDLGLLQEDAVMNHGFASRGPVGTRSACDGEGVVRALAQALERDLAVG